MLREDIIILQVSSWSMSPTWWLSNPWVVRALTIVLGRTLLNVGDPCSLAKMSLKWVFRTGSINLRLSLVILPSGFFYRLQRAEFVSSQSLRRIFFSVCAAAFSWFLRGSWLSWVACYRPPLISDEVSKTVPSVLPVFNPWPDWLFDASFVRRFRFRVYISIFEIIFI